jgi:hypothetical protein
MHNRTGARSRRLLGLLLLLLLGQQSWGLPEQGKGRGLCVRTGGWGQGLRFCCWLSHDSNAVVCVRVCLPSPAGPAAAAVVLQLLPAAADLQERQHHHS